MKTFYLICCSMRTGSTLLQAMLNDAGLGNAREFLHGNQPTFPTYKEYARRIYNGNKRSPVFGWRVMWGQLWGQQRDLPEVWGNVPVQVMLDGIINAVNADVVKYIYLYRKDKLRQAVSFIRAQHIRRWHCPAGDVEPEVELPFDKETIDRVEYLINEYPKYDQMWLDYFAKRGIEPLTLVYEDMTASEAAIHDTFWRMADHIGARPANGYKPTIPHKKQAGADVERWIAKYGGDAWHVYTWQNSLNTITITAHSLDHARRIGNAQLNPIQYNLVATAPDRIEDKPVTVPALGKVVVS